MPPDAPPNPAAASLPDWIDETLIQDTLDVWRPLYGGRLSREEAIEMLRTTGRLFQALNKGTQDEQG